MAVRSSPLSRAASVVQAPSPLIQNSILEEELASSGDEASAYVSPTDRAFDVHAAFMRNLQIEQIATPIAAILALAELIEASTAGTMTELAKALEAGAEELKSRSENPMSLAAGCELFIAFVTDLPHEIKDFAELKKELVKQGQTYAADALTYREKIAHLAYSFIKDDSVILTHSYSRVVMQTLLHAHKTKRISVYVTESRPHGLGLKTHELLTAAGVPCTVILDSAMAYAMDRADFVLIGSEAVVESGGLVHGIGSNQMAIIAKAANKPLYALAESYKFHRLFPLSQDDLPTHRPDILSFSRPTRRPVAQQITARPSVASFANLPPSTPMVERKTLRFGLHSARMMTADQVALNPEVEYTRPYLISLVFSDVGILTPEGVSQYLVGMFAG